MNKIYKVIFNSAKGQYEVVSEIARNCRKSSQSSFSGTSFRFLGITVRNILLGLFLLGSSCAADAATVNNGDNLAGGSNITVTKDDTTKTITISASGLAKTTELDSVKSDVDKTRKTSVKIRQLSELSIQPSAVTRRKFRQIQPV